MSLRSLTTTLGTLSCSWPTGCWALSYDTTTCDVEGYDLDGTTLIGDVPFDTTVEWVDVSAARRRECLTTFGATLDLGRGCSLAISADGRGERLDIYEVSPDGLEGCGLEEGWWEVVDYGDSHVEVDGDIEATNFEDTICYVGDLRIVLDLTLSDDTASETVSGTIGLSGGGVGDSVSATCD